MEGAVLEVDFGGLTAGTYLSEGRATVDIRIERRLGSVPDGDGDVARGLSVFTIATAIDTLSHRGAVSSKVALDVDCNITIDTAGSVAAAIDTGVNRATSHRNGA